ncbi:hypothetical protein PoB_001248700 [Plakobranchus ocellatus]|uniref:Uncharacterized protein n=1 Tax=Plakobranchus ocellatus TaxID=259542 RepID=A0AAV3YSS0_9GAST|nr:hypothetical protein PoB_001248700 [Plakobranchus ocellatus]
MSTSGFIITRRVQTKFREILTLALPLHPLPLLHPTPAAIWTHSRVLPPLSKRSIWKSVCSPLACGDTSTSRRIRRIRRIRPGGPQSGRILNKLNKAEDRLPLATGGNPSSKVIQTNPASQGKLELVLPEARTKSGAEKEWEIPR